MSLQAKVYYTPEEYLASERVADYKSEYYGGEVFAVTGASRKHNLLTINIATSLNGQLRNRPCEVYASDMRVKVSPTGLYTYPDVVVVCGEAQFEDAHVDTLLNPTLIVEVLSKSTTSYDRGEKFAHYRKLASLAEYLVVAQDKHHVEHYAKQPDGRWLLSETDDVRETIALTSINCELVLADVYNKVEVDV